MNYILSAGSLYDPAGEKRFAYLKGKFSGSEKSIFSPDGTLLLRTYIRKTKQDAKNSFGIHSEEYIMTDKEGREFASARPGYAEEDDPEKTGWPLCRLPRINHASFLMAGQKYNLVMQNSRSYILEDPFGKILVRILHKGLCGGWSIEADNLFSPETVCGLFVFCRYIEQENEFVTV